MKGSLHVASAALFALAAAPAGAGGRSVHITVAATVMVRVSIEWERLPRELVVKPQDIERGYVEVDAVGIGVRSNNPAGVRIRFVARSAHLSDVDVEGRGPAIFVPQVGRGLQRQSIGVRLKLKLAPGAVPGTIAYPVSVSVTPA